VGLALVYRHQMACLACARSAIEAGQFESTESIQSTERGAFISFYVLNHVEFVKTFRIQIVELRVYSNFS
jgi:hypothetical protein